MEYPQKNQKITIITAHSSGLYIVTESGCLQGHSGANSHIQAGLYYLNQSFKISLFTAFITKRSLAGQKNKPILDLIIFFMNLLMVFPWQFFELWKRKPSFIYERYALLNFNTLLICKTLKIPHFFEINGLWKENQASGILSWMETNLISLSNYSFCMGLRGLLIPNAAYLNIENGVSRSFWEAFKNHQKVRKKIFNICFLGTLMQHHRLEMICKSIERIPKKIHPRMQIHFIGPINQRVFEIAKSSVIPVVLHGTQGLKSRIRLLKKMDCGFISGGGPYASFMKLFEYGSAKCPVIAPKTPNLDHWLKEDYIFFYQQDNPHSCAQALLKVYLLPDLSRIKASRFYQIIGKRFLWEKIFSIISKNIAHRL